MDGVVWMIWPFRVTFAPGGTWLPMAAIFPLKEILPDAIRSSASRREIPR